MIGGNRLNSRKQRAYDTILPPTGIYPYLLACFENLPKKTQSAFLAHVSMSSPEMEIVQ
jgi:hypothetical protein